MNDDSFFSKKGQRKVSSFIGQELLYDYMTGELDPERKKAVEDFARANKEAQMDMQKILNGMQYAEKLSQTKVSEALISKISQPSSYSQVLLQKIRFEEWSPALKMGIEASVVALGITIFAVLIPWHKLMDLKIGSNEIVLTEVENEKVPVTVSESETSSKESETFPDEGGPTPTTTTTLRLAAVAAVIPTTTTLTTTTTMAVAQKNPPAEKPTSTAVPVVAAEEKRQGELFRGTIEVTNVPAITPKLVERITELGARKAGQVELGWSKNGDSSYFHFTMPEGRYEELKALFIEFGDLQIQKEKHERVMPEGILRVIITVDEKK